MEDDFEGSVMGTNLIALNIEVSMFLVISQANTLNLDSLVSTLI